VGGLVDYQIDKYPRSALDFLLRLITNMAGYMSKDQTGSVTARIQGHDGMSAKTPVVSSAEGPSIQEDMEKLAAGELANPDVVATYNPNLAETTEVVVIIPRGLRKQKFRWRY
jgi:hypothetical protein